MKPPDELYRFHVANLQAIDTAIKRVTLSLRVAVSSGDKKTICAFVRLYALLLGAWAECRLCKLVYEPNGFNEQERTFIRLGSTQLEQWHTAVEIAFRKYYNVPKAPLSDKSLAHSTYSQYVTILDMLEKDLRPIIELRNKLAHGQWVYPLNTTGDDVAQEQMDALRVENLVSLQFKKALISYLSDVIHDLVVSRPTFERDFDKHYRAIVATRCNLQTRDYKSYVKRMERKYQRGKAKRARAFQSEVRPNESLKPTC